MMQCFQDHHFLLKKSALKKLDFKTLQAITLTAVKCKRSEGTKEHPSKTTVPVQNYRTMEDRSKGLKAVPHDHHNY